MPLYAYNRDIPDAPNNPSADQPLMKTNTNNIDNIIDEDHFSFDENNGGLHRQVRLPLRGGSPGTIPPGLVAGEGTLYTKTVTSTGILTETGLFYTPDNSSDEYQLTRTITADFAELGTNAAYGTPPATFTQTGGWTFLPGGMLMQYGFFGKTGATGTSGQVQFPVQWSTGAFSIQLTLYRNSGNQTLSLDSAIVPTTTTFNFLTSSSGSDGIYWTAIGN